MIEYKENFIYKNLRRMKESEDRLYIWGLGELAKKIARFLEKKGICFQGFLVSEKYAQDLPLEMMDHKVYIFEDYIETHFCDVIVGFNGYTQNSAGRVKNHIDNIYAFDFIGVLALEEENILTREMLEANKEAFDWLEHNLADQKSVDVYKDYLNQKMSSTYAKPYDKIEQYFDDSVYHLTEGEVFVDCGAYHGETSETFINKMQKAGIKYQKIYAIEPDQKNIVELKNHLSGKENIEIIEAGVWNTNGIMRFNEGNGKRSSVDEEGNTQIRTIAIDEVIKNERVTFIKMDVEGAELQALQGAKNTIERCRPKLAICVYHKAEDLITIPQYLKSINPEYKLYLRSYEPSGIETVLYAI